MKTILIVEDEKDIAELLETGLTRSGFEIKTAFDGKDAIEKVKENKPALVVLDVALPYMSGWEVLRWIKTNYPTTFVIMATAKNEVEDIKNGHALKADYYVTKPYEVNEILKGIQILFSLSGE